MYATIPWASWVGLIEPHYYRTTAGKRGRKAKPIEMMLRMYLLQVWFSLSDEGVEEDSAVFDKSAMGEDDTADLYEKAVKVVLRDKKCSTSYIQRRLSVGYNKAASLVERMEKEGIVGPSNHAGKRDILAGPPPPV